MSKAREKLLDYLEEQLNEVLAGLKDEFKKIPILYEEDSIKAEKGYRLAECNHMTNPKTVRVFLGSIADAMTPSVNENLKKIISHELIHCIQVPPKIENGIDDLPDKEKEAYDKMNKLNFFN